MNQAGFSVPSKEDTIFHGQKAHLDTDDGSCLDHAIVSFSSCIEDGLLQFKLGLGGGRRGLFHFNNDIHLFSELLEGLFARDRTDSIARNFPAAFILLKPALGMQIRAGVGILTSGVFASCSDNAAFGASRALGEAY